MRSLCRFLCLALLSWPALLLAADVAPVKPAGHWEGTIALPTGALAIRVDLSRDGDGWQGTIDIPAQALRRFKLSPVTVDGSAIGLVMPGIPGNPTFKGRLSEDGKAIAGEFQQGGGAFPFTLERKAAPSGGSRETAPGVPGKGLAGKWNGLLKAPGGGELELGLEVTAGSGGTPVGTLIQGAARVPLSGISEKEGTVQFQVPSIGGSFEGKFNPDGSELAGEWKQSGRAAPLLFRRSASTVAGRPQEPKKPYPYVEEEVFIENMAAGVKLAGTLTLPKGEGPHPAVILITGSGGQDRDEAVFGHRPFLVLADHLTRRGVAVLRCDDRGIGKSTGSFAKVVESDFVEDARVQLSYLKARKEIDSRRIGLIGHSEGGIVAPQVAAGSADVAFIVLLAGAGVPVEELLLRQSRDILAASGVDEALIVRNIEVQREVFRVLRTEPDSTAANAKVKKLASDLVSALPEESRSSAAVSTQRQVSMALAPWFRSMLEYDPKQTLRLVKCPVLALNGEKDLQVAARENLLGIAAALEEGGNKRVKTVELPGLNHLFQSCKTGLPQEYAEIAETMNPAALNIVSEWIRGVTNR